MANQQNQLAIYQIESGALELRTDNIQETIWASLDQISVLFDRDKSVISRHIKNIYSEEELSRKSTVAFFATVQKEGKREVVRNIENFNLDVILSVGYRVNSKIATKFRQWATTTLKQHITQGFTINQKRVEENKTLFLQTLEDLKLLTDNKQVDTKDILSLIQSFSSAFFALNSYDKNEFPQNGTIEEINASAEELSQDLQQLKSELINKGEATLLFAQEKKQGNLAGIFGNVFQSVFGQDAYPTIEEKAAHLLYFIIKNHPFNDGNKRSGAFSFIWLLQKAGYDFRKKISPETLTTLTILIAESDPNDKEKMIGIVKLLFNNTQ
ncbi:virulence protein RhuM/Fic/DOC family protein [Emticicia agri]|uniref:Fic/DOC family protein n=1 Tax=Emticicia agri TaxID=2492393 RepID=A0A4Q5LSR1_9BACT|nr:virulence protein RhuM/Fic/DOC family protein [Emticicia agri]RYU92638.1 Fic/DOC family protein [Emticicia agri]